MPNRMLRDWTQSEKIDGLTCEAERFFIRLIMKVDDYGCFYADARLLKANLFPLKLDKIRETDISRWMAECQKAGMIAVYESDQKKYLQIYDFRQRLDRSKSKFPLPIKNEAVNGFREVVNEFPPEVEVETEVEVEGSARKKIFTKPSLDEVINEMKNDFEAKKFFNYYESNGWRVGRNPMKNWQAAARNWLQNSKNYATVSGNSETGTKRVTKSAGAHQLADLLKTELTSFEHPGGQDNSG